MALHLRKCRIAIDTALVTTLLRPLSATAAGASTAQRAGLTAWERRKIVLLGVLTGARTRAGRARTYRIVVLSQDNPTARYGVRTIERVAQAVHRALNRGSAAGQELSGQPVKIGHERVSGRRKLS